MAVVTRYGTAVKDPASALAVNANVAEGLDRTAYSKVSVSSDSNTSLHLLARLPSNARLRPGSTLYYSALTGLTSYSIGLGVNGAIVNSKTAALVSAEDIHLAGSVLLSKAIAAGSLGKQLWDLAGYAADPGGMIDIIGTVGADCSTTGTLEAFIGFFK